jgi:hypothetical protein
MFGKGRIILQLFRLKGDRLVLADAYECITEAQAWERAERAIAGRIVGARIIEDTSEPHLGEYEEPEILKTFGRVPDPVDSDD